MSSASRAPSSTRLAEIVTAEARLVDRTGTLYATASSSALVLAGEHKPSLAAQLVA